MWDFVQNEILGMQWLNRLIGWLLSLTGLDTLSRTRLPHLAHELPISHTITPISYTITPISHTISKSVEMGFLL